jgi:micrococcal nuclease
MRRLLFATVFSLGLAMTAPSITEAQEVEFVYDGDSFRADMGVLTQSVRMVGIECPEGTASAKARREARRLGLSMKQYLAIGDNASKFTRSMLPKGSKFRIEYDVEKRDKYGRLLGYVFLPNGKMLNEELVRAGYATLFPTEKNVKYKARLEAALKDAQKNKRGIWGLK